MTTFDGMLFGLATSRRLTEAVAPCLDVEAAPHEEREFDGGEHKTRPLVNVRGRDVYVVASLDGGVQLSANDKLCRLLFFVGALKQAAAGSVTVITPYLCYSRKERRTKARDPVTTRYVAQLFEAVGTDRLITLDVHDLAAFQNAFRCATEHLEATGLFVDHVRASVVGEPVVVSPDVGGVKRAERLRHRLATALGRPVDLAFTAKRRTEGVVSGPDQVLGPVEGRVAIVVDDMISSGTTMRRVAEMLADAGAAEIHLAATHGLFTPASSTLFAAPEVTSVVVTDSVDPTRLPSGGTGARLVVLPVAPLLAEAIARVHSGGSLVDLLHLDA